MENKNYTIKVLSNAINVLDELYKAGDKPLNPVTIARNLGISRGSVFRILKTLEPFDYVTYCPETRKYKLGLRFVEMGERVRQGIDFRSIARPYMRALGQKSGATIDIMALRDSYAVSIDRYYGSSNIEGDAVAGFPHPLHVGGSPKLLLAFLPELVRNRLVEQMELIQFTPNTVTNRRELYRRLEQIRVQGYSCGEGEYVPDVFAVGAPIYDRTGVVIAGLSASKPTMGMTEDDQQSLIKMTVSYAKKISAELGHKHK